MVTGYGWWSASGSEGGYQYHDQVCDSPEEAPTRHKGVIELGGTVGSTSSDLTGSTSRETKHPTAATMVPRAENRQPDR